MHMPMGGFHKEGKTLRKEKGRAMEDRCKNSVLIIIIIIIFIILGWGGGKESWKSARMDQGGRKGRRFKK